MTNNPFINAFAAALYISLVVTVVFNGERLFGQEETILIPMAMLSLFVLSAAVMGYIFLSQPVQMFFEGKKQEGITLFVKTVGTFAGITALLFIAMAILAR